MEFSHINILTSTAINFPQMSFIFIYQIKKVLIIFFLLKKTYLFIITSKPDLTYETSVAAVSENIQFNDFFSKFVKLKDDLMHFKERIFWTKSF